MVLEISVPHLFRCHNQPERAYEAGGKEGSIRFNQPDVQTFFSRCAILLTLTGRRALAPVF
jgi:hypothetical protein